MPEFNNPTTTLSYLEKGDKLMGGSPSEFANILADNVFNRSLTRAQLQALITASSLIVGQKYTITNAVGSTLSLVVCAVSENDLDEVAVSSTNGENYIYDIVTDTATQSENEIPFSINNPNDGEGLFYNGLTGNWENISLVGEAGQINITATDGVNTIGLSQDAFNENILRADLQNLISIAGLIVGKNYTITNAVSGSINLITNAVSTSEIDEVAIDNTTGENYIYNITSDTVVSVNNPIALGTANQLLGVNAGATAQQYKTLSGTANQVTVTHSVGGITLSLPQSIASTSSPTFASLSLTASLTAPNGGTGQSIYAVGDILYASTTTALSKLAGVATGNALISGGIGVAPSWGKVGLTTHISGTLGIGNGGTGLTATPTNGQIDIGNGTGFTRAAITGTANQVTVTNAAGSITLSLPQSINTTATPLFGRLAIGGNSLLSNRRITIEGTITGSTTAYGVDIFSPIQSDVTATAYGYRSNLSTQASSFTLMDLVHFAANTGGIGAGSSVTNQYGFRAQLGLTGATNNYGFYGDLPSASNTWNLYMNGTALNYLNGNLQIGSSIPLAGAEKLQVTGTARITGALAIGNTVQASVATPSTHKVTMVIGGVTYYLLASNV